MKHPVLRALLLSLLLHFVVVGGIELGHSAGLWKQRAVPSWLLEELEKQNAALDKDKQQTQPLSQTPNEEPPLLFVDVDASQAEEKPPENSKYYATVNTKAANAEKKQETLTPNLSGAQELIPKVTDTIKPSPEPDQPAPKPPEPKPAPAEPEPEAPKPQKAEPKPEPEQPKEEPKPPQKEGETMVARAVPTPPPKPVPQTPKETVKPVQEPTPKPRPRTLADARRQKGIIEGQRMKQEGGIGRIAMDSVDAAATPFGAYDAALIAAVQARWYTLLDDRDLIRNQAGRVAVEFRLHSDGRVTNLRVAESQVSETLGWICQRAILDPNPYAPFPNDLKRMLRTDYREVRFTFYYSN